MRKKVHWKKILFIGGSLYIAITVISTIVGSRAILNQKESIENHTTEIGQEFEKRKEAFQEKFEKNWNNQRDELIRHFAKSQKRSDQDKLDGMIKVLFSRESRLEKALKNGAEEEIENLKKEIQERYRYLALMQAAFAKKWGSQEADETPNQFQKRKDEGELDWIRAEIDRRQAALKWYPKNFESRTQNQIEDFQEQLEDAEARFNKKWKIKGASNVEVTQEYPDMKIVQQLVGQSQYSIGG